MSREPSHATSWVRWLAHCGLSPDHVVQRDGLVRRRRRRGLRARVHGRTRWNVSPEAHAEIHRLRAEGLTHRAIGADGAAPLRRSLPVAGRRDVATVGARPPRRLDADRPRVGGLTGTRFRRLLALGYEPSRVAELLQVNPAAVADLVERLTRRQGPGELHRPRSHREQAALSEWSRFIGPEPGPESAVAAGEGPAVEPVLPAIAPGSLPRARGGDQSTPSRGTTAGCRMMMSDVSGS